MMYLCHLLWMGHCYGEELCLQTYLSISTMMYFFKYYDGFVELLLHTSFGMFINKKQLFKFIE